MNPNSLLEMCSAPPIVVLWYDSKGRPALDIGPDKTGAILCFPSLQVAEKYRELVIHPDMRPDFSAHELSWDGFLILLQEGYRHGVKHIAVIRQVLDDGIEKTYLSIGGILRLAVDPEMN
jgi:hypothetical protein